MGTIDTVWKGYSDDERSVVADKGEIGFIDFEDDRSVCSYDPHAEGPVVISVPFPFVKGKPQSILIGETAVDCITIQNTTSEPIELWKVCIYASNPEESFTLSVMEPPSATSDLEDVQGFLESFSLDDRVLQPRKTMKVWLSCKPKEIGIHTTAVHFDAGDDRIERVVFLLAEDNISQSIAPNKPYSREPRKNRHNVTEFVRGSRPAKETKHSFKYFLPNYPIPKDKREILDRKEVPEELAMGLTRENYVAFFNILLIMEELELEEEMKNHDMEHVSMMRKRYYLALEVPGLAERRPSLVHGDFVFATPVTENPDNTPSYQGYIHQVEADFVLLKFSDDLHRRHRDGDLYNIRFTYNRTNMRRLYQAVQAAHKLETKFLFPSQSFRRIEAPKVVPLVPCINEEQQRSVEMILGCKGGPPYVIHGPPGTGKTMTLVETILQLYTTRRSARILVCASSNSAADHILEKLIGIEVATIRKQDIFRLNASSRPYEDVNPDHIHFCYFENYVFKCPPLRALNCYKIIISTYMSSSLLYAEGVKRGHFSHVFLDEAGQASEPETMIPISNLCCRETVVVLAGDPMQLGPIIYSRQAENYGLRKSYLERLFECEFYHNEDANFVIKLVKNYRCHQAILELPSKLFYKGELVACKKESDSCSDDWDDLLPNKDFPVLFVGIQGCDEREGNNPSWFNRTEVSKVIEIIQKLMRARDDLTEADIGVITPYRQQVLKLKKILEDKLDMPGIKVGSVEQFQGQERQVIIVSTVRSTIKHNEFDKIHYLGFLSNPRRFNVALTRAGSLLIIVGNPHIICKDPYWNKLLRYCADNDSYQGCPLPDVQEYPEEDLTGGYNVNCGGGWGDPQLTQAAEWGGELTDQQPSNEAGWSGEWTNAQPSQEAGWVDDWTDQQQTQEAGWGDPEPSNRAEWRDEWGEPEPSNGAELRDEWGDPKSSNGAELRDECGDPRPVNNAEWHDELGDPKPGIDAEWRDEWGDPKPGNNTGWHGEWGDPKPENRAERHGGWGDSKPGNRAARHGGWGDSKPGNRAARHGGCGDSKPGNRTERRGRWGDPKPGNRAERRGGWTDPTTKQ